MSILSIIWKFATGGVSGVLNCGLAALNAALDKITGDSKERVQAALNVAQKVASMLHAFKWICPVKWQTAYVAVLNVVTEVTKDLEDLEVTEVEAKRLAAQVKLAYATWNTDDDETCKE